MHNKYYPKLFSVSSTNMYNSNKSVSLKLKYRGTKHHNFTTQPSKCEHCSCLHKLSISRESYTGVLIDFV